MSDLPFGMSKDTYAALSPSDLDTMGKRASALYLGGESSLNDAIVKLAREYPSISHHQVQRVIEFANQETFARLFEKNAQDKNVVFDVAEPSHIFHELNNGARPYTMEAPADEYSQGPVKLAHSDVEADLHLTRLFLGVDMAEGLDKTSATIFEAKDGVVSRVLGHQKFAEAADRILAAGEGGAAEDSSLVMSDQGSPQGARQISSDEEAQKLSQPMDQPIGQPVGQGQAVQQGPVDAPLDDSAHHERMMQVQREIEYAKKMQEYKGIQDKMMAPPPGAVEESLPPGGQAVGPSQPQGQQGMAMPMMSGAPKVASAFTKEAMAYAKSGRPNHLLLIQGLEGATSLDSIKQATARAPAYRESEPYGDLVRTKQKVAALRQQAYDACQKNTQLIKEAFDRYIQSVKQHVLGDGDIGEMVHAMGSVPNNPRLLEYAVKQAMQKMADWNVDPLKAKAMVIQYEMQKGASARCANPDHPVVQSFLDYQKVAESQKVFDQGYRDLDRSYQEVESAVKEAVRVASR